MSTEATAVQTNPFPGLRPFRETERHLFFGRERQVNTMVNKLADTRFLAIVGASGSGKSSLVNCGLRPALHVGRMTSAGSAWRVAQFRPGSDPQGALANVLAADGVLYSGYDYGNLPLDLIIETNLRMSKRGLIETYREANLKPNVNLLVVVDQFEELFRYRQLDEAQEQNEYGVSTEATAFVNLLLEIKEQAEYPIYVVITMRSDFLGDCAQFAGLPEAINEGQYLVPRMTRDERRAAIAGHGAVGAAEFSPVLLTRLINDVGDNPDQLSILQHALNRTWACWASHGKKGPVALSHYEEIGTMAQALDQHAEQAYAELDTAPKQYLCQKIFKALTDKATDIRGIRRPTKLGTLCALADASEEEVVEVIEVFRDPTRSFLVPPVGKKLEAETVIDISHESLMRVWQRLKTWADEETQSAQIYRRLVETAGFYQAGRAGLWRDPELQLALDWREKEQPTAAWAGLYLGDFEQAIGFLDESLALREREAQEAETRHQREIEQALLAKTQARRTRRLLIGLSIVAVFAVIAVGAAFYASRQQGIAEEQRQLAEGHRQRAEANAVEAGQQRQLALANADSANTQREFALKMRGIAEANASFAERQRMVAVANADTARFERQRAEGHRQTAEAQADTANTQRQLAEQEAQRADSSATVAQQERRIAMSARLETLGLALADEALRQQKKDQAELGALLAREAYRFNTESNGEFLSQVYDALRVNLNALNGAGGPSVLAGPNDWVRTVAYSPNGRWIAAAGNEPAVYLWPAGQRAARVLGGHRGIVRSLAFSPDGSRLASGSDDGTLRVWNHLDQNQPESKTLGPLQGLVRSLAFSPDGRYLAAAPDGNTIQIWNLADLDAAPVELPRPDGAVHALAFSPNGATLASANADGTVRLSVVVAGGASGVLSGHSGAVHALAFNPSGNTLASGSRDETVRLWNVATGAAREVLRGHRGPVNAVAFSPDGARLASGGSDQTVRLWQVNRLGARPLILQEHTASVRSLAFSPNGQRLVSGSVDKTVRLWNIHIDRLAEAVCAGVRRALTEQEWKEFVGEDIAYSTYVPCPSGTP